MKNYFEKKQFEVLETLKKYSDLENLKNSIITKTSKTLMSKDKRVSLYGMFLPDKKMEYIVTKYRGKLTNNEAEKNYKYYFDDKDRVILTERCYSGKTLNYIFYFYYDRYVDIVWYDVEKQIISDYSKICYNNDVIYSYLEISNIKLFISFQEYFYKFENDNLYLKSKTYFKKTNGEIIVSENEFFYR